MKSYFVFFLLLFIFRTPFCQSIKWNEPINSSSRNGNYGFQKVNDDLSYFSLVPPSMLPFTNAQICSFDKKGEVNSKEISEILPIYRERYQIETMILGENLILFGHKTKGLTSKIYIAGINKKTTIIFPEKKIAEFNSGKEDVKIGGCKSPNGEIGLIYYLVQSPNENANSLQFGYFIVEENGIVAEGVQDLKVDQLYIDDFTVHLTNEATFVIEYTEFARKQYRRKSNLNAPLSLHFIHVAEDKLNYYEFDFLGNRPLGMQFNFNEPDLMLVNGGYSSSSDDVLDGVFVYEADFRKTDGSQSLFIPFKNNVNFKQEKKSFWTNRQTISEFGLSDNFKLKQVFVNKENTTFIFEEDFFQESTTNDNRGIMTTRIDYFHNDILTIVLDQSGRIVNSQLIIKEQRSSYPEDSEHSFFAIQQESQLHILFNSPQNLYSKEGERLDRQSRRKLSSRKNLCGYTYSLDLFQKKFDVYEYQGIYSKKVKVDISSFSNLGEPSIMMVNMRRPRGTYSEGKISLPNHF